MMSPDLFVLLPATFGLVAAIIIQWLNLKSKK